MFNFDHDSHSMIQNWKMICQDLEIIKWNGMKWIQKNSYKNAWICARSIIFKGVTIGESSIVAAGSIVTKDVPDFCLVSGNPAKYKKSE